MVADWQADMQTRHDWAQLGLAPAELSTSVQIQTVWDIDPGYETSADNEALRAIFRAHRAAQRDALKASMRSRETVLRRRLPLSMRAAATSCSGKACDVMH